MVVGLEENSLMWENICGHSQAQGKVIMALGVFMEQKVPSGSRSIEQATTEKGVLFLPLDRTILMQ